MQEEAYNANTYWSELIIKNKLYDSVQLIEAVIVLLFLIKEIVVPILTLGIDFQFEYFCQKQIVESDCIWRLF